MHKQAALLMTTSILSSAFLTVVLVAPAGAQTSPASKTVILQLQTAVLNTREGHQAFTALDAKFAPRKAELEKKQNEIGTLQEQFQKRAATFSADAQRALGREIDKKTKALNYEAETTQADYEQEQGDIVQSIERKFHAVVDKYARDNGFGIVLDVTNPQTGAFWWGNALDITNEVVRAYDAAYPVANTPEAPAGAQKEEWARR
jgi:outer membrane protein